MTTSIYFAKSGHRIKIGVSKNVERRLREVGAHLAEPIELLLAAPGGIEAETAIHRALFAHHIRGEWFYDNGEVRDLARNFSERGLEAVADYRVTPAEGTEFGHLIVEWARAHYAQGTSHALAQLTAAPHRTAEYWLSTGRFPGDAVCALIRSVHGRSLVSSIEDYRAPHAARMLERSKGARR